MEQKKLYLALEQSTLVSSRKVHIGDISTIFCCDPDITHKIKTTELFVFSNTKQDQSVVSVMKLIEMIETSTENVSVVSIGSPEIIVYYKNLTQSSKWSGKIKAILLMVLAFFGTAYSIMSYNGDVGAIDLLSSIYQIFTGKEAVQGDIGSTVGILSYSVGLMAGMIIFFNHGINNKVTDDPTPLQVQMRLYEEDVNKAIIVNSSRRNQTIDVD